MLTLTRDLRQLVIAALGTIPLLNTRSGRDLLLADLPRQLQATIPRSDVTLLDFSSILEAAEAYGRLESGRGPAALQIILENACSLAPESKAGRELRAILDGATPGPAPTTLDLARHLDGAEFKHWQEVLLRAFPRRSELEQMVRFGLNQSLADITIAESLAALVFALIQWADAHGRLADLLRGARAMNPDNAELATLAARYNV